MANQYTHGWTEKEIHFLEENIGVLSFEKMAQQLKKTPVAVESQIDKRGIGNTKIVSGYLTMHELSIALCLSDKTVKRLIVQHGLPAERKDFRLGDRYSYHKDGSKKEKRLFYYINMDLFWQWAESHKDLINWHQVPKYALTFEPDWLEARRKEDYYKWLKRRRLWTKEQDQLLLHYFYKEALPQKKIALLLGRTPNAVEKRLKRLREKEI